MHTVLSFFRQANEDMGHAVDPGGITAVYPDPRGKRQRECAAQGNEPNPRGEKAPRDCIEGTSYNAHLYRPHSKRPNESRPVLFVRLVHRSEVALPTDIAQVLPP
jgi:hypothetical protein